MNKVFINTAIAMFCLSGSLAIAEDFKPRLFYNQDKTKFFLGTLYGYNKGKDHALLLDKNGIQRSVALKQLSNECKDYVETNYGFLQAGDDLKIRFEKVTDGKNEDKTATQVKYDITVLNNSQTDYEDITVEWSIYVGEGNYETKGRNEKNQKIIKGSTPFEVIRGSERELVGTDLIDVYNHQKYSKKKITIRTGGGGG